MTALSSSLPTPEAFLLAILFVLAVCIPVFILPTSVIPWFCLLLKIASLLFPLAIYIGIVNGWFSVTWIWTGKEDQGDSYV
jgi:hypothetical protein